jgi:ABC-type transport system involved in cytochrome c biogenesis permease subunit
MRFDRIVAAWLCLGWMAACGLAAEVKPLDLSLWQRLPVFHNGRVMPLDTFAATAVEIICDRSNPTLALEGAVPSADLEAAKVGQRPSLQRALELFPDGKQRRWAAPELLLSWLAEGEKWEDVPFFACRHRELRELLDVPLKNEAGEWLMYVSPRQIQDSEKFQLKLEELFDRRREAQRNQTRFELAGPDKKIEELYQAYSFFRELTFWPNLDGTARGHFERGLSQIVNSWTHLAPVLQGAAFADDAELPAILERCQNALALLSQLSQQPAVARDEADQGVEAFASSLDGLMSHFALKVRPENLDKLSPEQSQSLRQAVTSVFVLVGEADELAAAVHDNAESLRVVPALNAQALERDRDPAVETHPWLDLETLVFGSMRALRAYPQTELLEARSAFLTVAKAYSDRRASDRPAAFRDAVQEFAKDLRILSEKIEPLRAQMASEEGMEVATSLLPRKVKIKAVDRDLMEHTRYPAAGALENEVFYNASDPFRWSWVLSLLAVFAFSVAFGPARKPMYWTGVVLMIACLAWSCYGFFLRISVTGWAPVTNMYETVIYVPFIVASLGFWFALLPLTWPGIERVWNLTALPFTWESRGLEPVKSTLGWASRFVLVALRLGLLVLAFLMMSVFDYAAGGEPLIRLLPQTDVGSTIPSLNSLLVWLASTALLLVTLLYVPRLLLTAAAGIPLGLFHLSRGLRPALEQVYRQKPYAIVATVVSTFLWIVAWYGSHVTTVLNANFEPLQPVLRDNVWLTIHVLTIVASYGAGALAWGLGMMALGAYLFGRYRDPAAHSEFSDGRRPAGDAGEETAGRRGPEMCDVLAGFIYRSVQVAVLLLAAGTILGGLWADVSWGRFWGWDPKEVWALISLLVYLAILHGRYAGWIGKFGLVTGTVLGATAITMSWYGVNFVLGVGLHSYGFVEGRQGQHWVFLAIGLNWLFAGAAALRYWFETRAMAREAVA